MDRVPTFRMDVPTYVNYPHRRGQRFVSYMIVNPIKVTINITITGSMHIYLHSSRAQGVSCIP